MMGTETQRSKSKRSRIKIAACKMLINSIPNEEVAIPIFYFQVFAHPDVFVEVRLFFCSISSRYLTMPRFLESSIIPPEDGH